MYIHLRYAIRFGQYEEYRSSSMQHSTTQRALVVGLYISSEHPDNRLCIRSGHISTFETATDRRVAPARETTHSFRLTESIYWTVSNLRECAKRRHILFSCSVPTCVCLMRMNLVRHSNSSRTRLFVLIHSPFAVTARSAVSLTYLF
jgi:hypothetical protein